MSEQDTAPSQVQKESIINQEALSKLFSEKLPVPYLALITTYVILVLALVINLAGLTSYGISQLFDTGAALGISSLLFKASVSSIVMAQIATLIVVVPTIILVRKLIASAEADETWRQKQKARRVIYTFGITLMVLALVSVVVNFVQALLAAGLASNPGMAFLQAIVSGAVMIAIASTGLYILVNSNTKHNESGVKTTLLAIAIVAAILAAYGLFNAYNTKTPSRGADVEKAIDSLRSSSSSSNLRW